MPYDTIDNINKDRTKLSRNYSNNNIYNAMNMFQHNYCSFNYYCNSYGFNNMPVKILPELIPIFLAEKKSV